MGTTSSTLTSSSSPISPFDGQRLGKREIRLLTLKSANGTVELETRRHVLTRYLEYDAISYVWGTAPASMTVLCNNKPLLVTPAALEMFQYLCKYQAVTVNRQIWVDAICINQGDPEEKNIQIPLMREIYSRAATVVVWMGPSTPKTDVFLAELQDVRERSKHWMEYQAVNPGCEHPVREELPVHEESFWWGLDQICNNEWFRRLWTFQEIILPNVAILLCGNSWVDFDDFVSFIVDGSSYILMASKLERDSISHDTIRACFAINYYRRINSERGKVMRTDDVAHTLIELRLRNVKEQVDRVWAITGLLDNGLQKTLSSRIDYSDQSRREFWKTWIMFAKVLVEKSGGIKLLFVSPTLEPRPSRLPSWCPNLAGTSACNMAIFDKWNMSIGNDQICAWARFEENSEEASLERRMAIRTHKKRSLRTVKKDNMLRIRGFVVDIVDEVVEHDKTLDVEYQDYDRNSKEHMALYLIAVYRHLESLDLARRVIYGKSKGVTDVPDEFIMVFFLDCRITEAAKIAYRATLPRLMEWYTRSNADLRFEHAECKELSMWLRRHTFFSTKGGRIGIAQPGCRPGDKVVVYYGGDPLYIHRQFETSAHDDGWHGKASDHVQHLGAAFIPHLMEQHQRDAAHIGPDRFFFIH